MKYRISANQKDTLFILALLNAKNVTSFVPLSKVKSMIEQSKVQELDPANYRKGMHTLAQRGLIEMVREHNLSLSMRLTDTGREQAAKIYLERTGEELVAQSAQNDQITVFEAIDSQMQVVDEISIEERIEREYGDDYSVEQIEEMTEKFNDVVIEWFEYYDLDFKKNEFEVLLFDALKQEGARAFLNKRAIRRAAADICGFK
ncbi:hypothetical protein [Photobacterium leiognathi]|uniref:hypothetical protein n=1 Tax=Photobacterium leiognathi TaxID=553611 RepID=UPI0027397BBC|nr:hypothetical protein [Photobacterium leiognathi]